MAESAKLLIRWFKSSPMLQKVIPVWCNGSAAVSKSASGGSIPSTGASIGPKVLMDARRPVTP